MGFYEVNIAGGFASEPVFNSYFFVLLPSRENERDKLIYDTFVDMGRNTKDCLVKIFLPQDDGFEPCRKYFGIDSVPAFVVTTNCEVSDSKTEFSFDIPQDALYFKKGFFIDKVCKSHQVLYDIIFNIHLACRDVNRGLNTAKKDILWKKIKISLGFCWNEVKTCISFSKSI